MARPPLETKILDGLVAHHPGIPTDVLRRKARARLRRKAVNMAERGMTQSHIAAVMGCSQPHVHTSLIGPGREEKASGRPSPLAEYLRQQAPVVSEPVEIVPVEVVQVATTSDLDAVRLDLQRRRREAKDQDEKVRLGHALLRLLDLDEDLRLARARVQGVEERIATLLSTLP